ncbi:phosphotransferase system (PTS), putative ribitol /mannitol-specific enzyme IIAB component [Corynebacterium renale]|uniref:PTS sugar transporter subunit IIA n=1 Tax=Corynebacterium renale TaxID=1724 RepID=UPI000DA2D2A8|nr:PTS sugar transporter subunit IIA [Corynebacterium renale]SQG63463.1 phosphotransferase system (PTS), putative ribitol /mannitol-specific enzyme IIAB component [Corynebacterium renale]STD00230.1 phosphotransferase system (PTS), putative ribitol /mannitol-specific enzyme IIAB component [Corynebacterium renale]
MSALNRLLADESIDLAGTATDWEDALRQAGKLLEATGNVESAYTQSMIDSVHEKGPYIVVAPGFAFAHARPSEAVHTTTAAWLKLTEPVEFGHKNDPVSLVVALAATDTTGHQQAMAEIAKLLGKKRAELDAATTPGELRAVLEGVSGREDVEKQSGDTRNKILTVCGNGLGTSLFLKNTVEDVLGRWGWAKYITVEATDTISAKGKAKEADLILTSGEIARTLGDLGVPLRIIDDFTSAKEVDAVLRDSYDI